MTLDTGGRFLDRATPPHIFTLVLMAAVSALNMSIFLPSLPAMTEEFGTTYGIMQLSVSLYLGFTAVMQLFAGPLADKYGRRRVMLWTLTVFLLATAGCLLSTSIEAFLFFRMLQSAVAVSMVMSRAIVRDLVEERESAAMIGYVTMGMSLVPMIAPALGGVLEVLGGWRLTFGFVAGFGVLLMALCYFDQGETVRSGGLSFRDQLREYPELFTSRRFWGYALAAAFSSGAFFAFLGGAPYVATEVYNLSPTTAGMFFGVPPLGYFFGSMLSGRYSVQLGVDRMIFIGCGLLLFGMSASLVAAYVGYESAFSFFAFVSFVGIGNGMVLPNANAGLLSVRPHLAGTASGVGSAIMIGGGAALAAFVGAALKLGGGSLPLQWIMWGSAAAALRAILYVRRRAHQVGAA